MCTSSRSIGSQWATITPPLRSRDRSPAELRRRSLYQAERAKTSRDNFRKLSPLDGEPAAREYVNFYAYLHTVVDKQISALLDKGMDRPAIIAIYRAKYGEKILSSPTTEGFNLLAWVMPFFALFVGGGFVVLMLGRWRHETPSLPEAPGSEAGRADAIDSRLREQLDAEVKRQL